MYCPCRRCASLSVSLRLCQRPQCCQARRLSVCRCIPVSLCLTVPLSRATERAGCPGRRARRSYRTAPATQRHSDTARARARTRTHARTQRGRQNDLLCRNELHPRVSLVERLVVPEAHLQTRSQRTIERQRDTPRDREGWLPARTSTWFPYGASLGNGWLSADTLCTATAPSRAALARS